jgi:hypothetical protein
LAWRCAGGWGGVVWAGKPRLVSSGSVHPSPAHTPSRSPAPFPFCLHGGLIHSLVLACAACAEPVQVVEDGYEFFAKRQLVTLFSAPNYCGEFDNAGAMMSVDDTLMCSFQVRGCA